MKLQNRFTDNDLLTIVEEAAIYMCACPGQVADEIRQLRHLIRYQENCLLQGDTLQAVHQTIAAAAREAHATMEDCLERVLELESWDRKTLKMPAGLRKRRDELIAKDS